MSRERSKANNTPCSNKLVGAKELSRVGRWAKLNGEFATKRMAWPQYVEGKKGVEWWSPLPIKTEEPKNAMRSLSNLIQLSGVGRIQSGCSE